MDDIISIHAPRMGSDECDEGGGRCGVYFNPRSPDGERLARHSHRLARNHFNPRSPDGERRSRSRVRRAGGNFNPRSPDGERPASRSAGS